MSKGQRAMAVAMAYPDAEKGGRALRPPTTHPQQECSLMVVLKKVNPITDANKKSTKEKLRNAIHETLIVTNEKKKRVTLSTNKKLLQN
jgi:hypothetical protein